MDQIVCSDMGQKLNVWELEFDSEQHAYNWYNTYARGIGFSIRRQWKGKDGEGNMSSRGFVCCKQGYRKEVDLKVTKKVRRDTRCGCPAEFSIQRKPHGKFRTYVWRPQHNHELVPNEYVHMLPSQRNIKELQAIEIERADNSGIRPKLAHEYLANQVGGRENLGFLHLDVKNYLNGKRNRDLKFGEAGSLLNYFASQHEENEQFFYRVQLDSHDQITNIFWADSCMRVDYGIFGDFLSFDTTYRTNKDYRPLGVFMGINHHYEQVVFGACLLYDETTQSFRWLFEMFFKCMHGKKPQSIFTDRDAAMAKAIAMVMPDTCHKLCLWHIMQNALSHLQTYFGKKCFSDSFNRVLYDGECEEDFNEAWKDLVETYNLQDNAWLKELYKTRYKWAMALGRDTFCAGKRSTQISESFNGRLREYLKSDMDLVQFFRHFQRVLKDLRYNEKMSNCNMIQKIPRVKISDPLLENAREIYTEAIFKIFQDEHEKANWVEFDSRNEEEGIVEYKVHNCVDNENHDCAMAKKHTITSSGDFHLCSCKKFQFVGVICSHIIKILRNGSKLVRKIPEVYVLQRWTKKARFEIAQETMHDVEAISQLEKAARFTMYSNTFVGTISKYIDCEKTWKLFESAHKQLVADLEECVANGEVIEKEVANDCDGGGEGEIYSVGDEEILVRGLKKREVKYKSNKRLKSGIEKRRNVAKKKKTVVVEERRNITKMHKTVVVEASIQVEHSPQLVDEQENPSQREGVERWRNLDELM